MPAGASVTVLVSTRDRPQGLERCLRAVLAGSTLPAALIVVDQSRDDRSADVVRRLQAEGADRLRLVRDDGAGLSRSQNLGLRAAATPVVLVTDDDCVPEADWVARAEEAFAEEPGLDLLAGRVLPLPADAPGLQPVSTRTSPEPRELDATTAPWDVGSGNNFAVTARAVARTGGNDLRLGPGAPWRGGADMDLFHRVLRDGGPGRYDPRVVVLHEQVTREERRGRRVPYGYGMGACLVLWRRQGDPQALPTARGWLRLRLLRLAEGVRGRDRQRVGEEALVLLGTLRGAARAVRSPAGPCTGP